LKPAAARAAADYAHALHLMRPRYPGIPPRVLEVSALEGRGIVETWAVMAAFREQLSASGTLGRLREAQLKRWFWSEVQAVLAELISTDPAVAQEAAVAEAAVAAGTVLPDAAARQL